MKIMPESKFSVGDRVVLSHAETVWTIKKINYVGEQFYITATREGYGNDGSYYDMEVEYFEERFEPFHEYS